MNSVLNIVISSPPKPVKYIMQIVRITFSSWNFRKTELLLPFISNNEVAPVIFNQSRHVQAHKEEVLMLLLQWPSSLFWPSLLEAAGLSTLIEESNLISTWFQCLSEWTPDFYPQFLSKKIAFDYRFILWNFFTTNVICSNTTCCILNWFTESSRANNFNSLS